MFLLLDRSLLLRFAGPSPSVTVRWRESRIFGAIDGGNRAYPIESASHVPSSSTTYLCLLSSLIYAISGHSGHPACVARPVARRDLYRASQTLLFCLTRYRRDREAYQRPSAFREATALDSYSTKSPRASASCAGHPASFANPATRGTLLNTGRSICPGQAGRKSTSRALVFFPDLSPCDAALLELRPV